VTDPEAILIAGPTASGKSALALALAEKLGGMVVNVDSMQVYGDLRVITARPGPDDERRVPHVLYGHVDAAENYSVGGWVVDARHALAEARRAGRIPIMVGGTGLYFKALLRGLAAVPPVPAAVRNRVRKRLAEEGVGALHAELASHDPAMAGRLMPADRSRVTRALEVVLATGRSLAEWQVEGQSALIDTARTIRMFLAVDRVELYRRIDTRFDRMLAEGALEEVEKLARRGLDSALPAMKAHGVPWLIRHLRGELTLADAAEAGKRDTRRYTKRQETWFRNQLPDWTWSRPDRAATLILEEMSRFSA
jgi:tRNA dimethylallyltransferase